MAFAFSVRLTRACSSHQNSRVLSRDGSTAAADDCDSSDSILSPERVREKSRVRSTVRSCSRLPRQAEAGLMSESDGLCSDYGDEQPASQST